LEVADLVRAAGSAFTDNNEDWLNGLHLKVLTAIERCRTAALGGHVDRCGDCCHQTISFNSCRNRHCPRCQSNARDHWIEARSRDLLAVPYAHVVFTLPHELAPLALQNRKVVYDLLFRASVATSAKSPAIQRTSAPTSGSSLSFTPGIRSWSIIRMSTA
jgi:hypothetical protein